jgi:hypothetical protein
VGELPGELLVALTPAYLVPGQLLPQRLEVPGGRRLEDLQQVTVAGLQRLDHRAVGEDAALAAPVGGDRGDGPGHLVRVQRLVELVAQQEVVGRTVAGGSRRFQHLPSVPLGVQAHAHPTWRR